MEKQKKHIDVHTENAIKRLHSIIAKYSPDNLPKIYGSSKNEISDAQWICCQIDAKYKIRKNGTSVWLILISLLDIFIPP